MSLVACPRCGSQFDISQMEPGSQFTCGACENVLSVPASSSPPAAPVVAPAVAKPAARPAAKKKPDPRRAGGAAQKKGTGRAERLREQRAHAGPKKKNPLPLVGALVGVIALVGFVATQMGGDDGDGDKGGGDEVADTGGGSGGDSTSGGGDSGTRKTPAQTLEEKWPTMTATEQKAVIETKVKDARRDEGKAQDNHQWLLAKGLKEDADRCLQAAKESFPDDEWVNSQLGLRNRREDIFRIGTDEEITFQVEHEDLQKILDLMAEVKKDRGKGWLTAEQSAELDGWIKTCVEENEKLSDPTYARTQQEYNNLRNNPSYTGIDFEFKSAGSYVIFAESAGENSARAAEQVDLTGKALNSVYENFLKFMKDELGLDPPRLSDMKDHRLKVFVFKSRESFDDWHVRKGGAAPEFAAAYYSPGGNQMIMMHSDAFDVGVIMHEGTHQLIHTYKRYFTQKDDDAYSLKNGEPTEEVKWTDGRLSSGFFWFQEGIAEYFGGAEKLEEGEWKPGALHGNRIGHFQYETARNGLWELRDFVFNDQGQVRARAKVKAGGMDASALNALLYAQGWTLVHYLMHGDNEKWRPKFLKFIQREMMGYTGKPELLKAFGLPHRGDEEKVNAWMQDIDRSYREYHKTLLQKAMAGKKR